MAKRGKRHDKGAPAIGGIVGEDTTRQARRLRARRDVAEMARAARRALTAPTTKEVLEVGRTRADG